MPIVDVEIVLRPGEALHQEVVVQLADELSEIFQSPRGGTWVKIRGLSVDHYAENGRRPAEVYPIFISVLKAKFPETDEIEMEVEKITGAVARICGRPSENVHVIYQPEARGRVAFGGKMVS